MDRYSMCVSFFFFLLFIKMDIYCSTTDNFSTSDFISDKKMYVKAKKLFGILPLKAKVGVVVGVGFWLITEVVGATEGFTIGSGSTSFIPTTLSDASLKTLLYQIKFQIFKTCIYYWTRTVRFTLTLIFHHLVWLLFGFFWVWKTKSVVRHLLQKTHDGTSGQ